MPEAYAWLPGRPTRPASDLVCGRSEREGEVNLTPVRRRLTLSTMVCRYKTVRAWLAWSLCSLFLVLTGPAH
jgi:hypothetical protein